MTVSNLISTTEYFHLVGHIRPLSDGVTSDATVTGSTDKLGHCLSFCKMKTVIFTVQAWHLKRTIFEKLKLLMNKRIQTFAQNTVA